MIHIRHDETFHQYDLPSQDCPEFSDGLVTSWVPTATSLPCTVQELPNDEFHILQDLPILVPRPQPLVAATFSDYIDDLPSWEKHLFESLDMYHTCFEMITLITDAVSEDNDIDLNLISVSDGSAFDLSLIHI